MNTSPYKLGYQAAQAQTMPVSCPKTFKGVDKKDWERGYKLGLVVAKRKATV